MMALLATVRAPNVIKTTIRTQTIQTTVERQSLKVAVKGLQGAPGIGATISADDGNTISLGSDDGLFAPGPQLSTAQW